MLQKIYQVILQKFPSELEAQHGLLVALDKNICESSGIRNNLSTKDCTSFIGAVMRNYPLLYEPLDCKFTHITLLDISDSNCDFNIIPLYVTECFLKEYNYEFDDVCYMKPVLCYPLEKVLFGTKTIEIFNSFQSKEQLSLLTKLITENSVLCLQGHVPLPSSVKISDVFNFSDLLTLDCQPFRQGLLTSNSSLVLSDISDVPDVTERRITSNSTNGSSVLGLNLIQFTSSIIGFKLPSVLPSVVPSPTLNPTLALKILYEIQILPKPEIDFQLELQKADEAIDPLNTIFMSYNVRKRMNMKKGDWVKIRLSKCLSKQKEIKQINDSKGSAPVADRIERLAQVCIFSNKRASFKHFASDDMVYISPLLWFNLNKHPSCLVQEKARLVIEPLEDAPPPYAREVYACLIQCPNYDGKIETNVMLERYFTIPRFVCIGDVISLNSKDQPDFHSRILDEEVDLFKWPVVHFYVSRIDGPQTSDGYLISSSYSRLYQSGTKQRYVPVTMETYYQLTSYHPIWNSIPNGLSYYVNKIQELILPFLKLKSNTQISCNILLTGPPCCGKTTVVKAVCKYLNMHLYKINCYDFTGEVSAVIEGRLKAKIIKGSSYAPCIFLFKNIHCIGKEKDTQGEDSRVIHALSNILKELNSYTVEWPILAIGTAFDQRQLSNSLVSAFVHSVHMTAPNEEERCMLLKDLLTTCDVGNDVSISYIAQRTAGFVLGDLSALVNQAIKNAYNRIETMVAEKKLHGSSEEDLILASVPVVQKDLLNALEKLHSEFADAIGAPKIPNVKFEDVGGLSDVKQEILDTIQLPLEHPEILFSGLRRSGVLLYGPPGSGKTLLAKAVATECSLNFLSVKGPELINMYVGQSEENVRAVFNQARSAVPCIIFFDELDSLAPNRGRSGDSGGVMDRVVSQLLAELDGLNKKSEVFVIGATNRPDLLDPALLRPGRFDRLLYVGIPEDNKSKLSILKALTRKFPLAEDVNMEEIVDKCPPHLSGADFYSLCSNAVMNRVEQNVEMLEKGEKKMEDISCEVTTEDFLNAIKRIVPSVSPDQYNQYQAIKAKIENK